MKNINDPSKDSHLVTDYLEPDYAWRKTKTNIRRNQPRERYAKDSNFSKVDSKLDGAQVLYYTKHRPRIEQKYYDREIASGIRNQLERDLKEQMERNVEMRKILREMQKEFDEEKKGLQNQIEELKRRESSKVEGSELKTGQEMQFEELFTRLERTIQSQESVHAKKVTELGKVLKDERMEKDAIIARLKDDIQSLSEENALSNENSVQDLAMKDYLERQSKFRDQRMGQFFDSVRNLQTVLGKNNNDMVKELLGDLCHIFAVEQDHHAKAVEKSQLVMQEYVEISKQCI